MNGLFPVANGWITRGYNLAAYCSGSNIGDFSIAA